MTVSLRHALSVVVALTVIACSDQRDATPGFVPSPLGRVDRDRDPDRLFILVRAGGGVKPVCGDYFAAPTRSENAALSTECKAWQLAMLDHLRRNGITDLEPQHLEDPTFWRWWAEAQGMIARCREAVREHERVRREAREPGWRLPNTAGFRDCDAYDKALQGEGKSLVDLNIVRARVSATDDIAEP